MVPYAGLSFYCFEMLKYFCMKYLPQYACEKLDRNTGNVTVWLFRIIQLYYLCEYFCRRFSLVDTSKVIMWRISWCCSSISVLSVRRNEKKDAVSFDESSHWEVWVISTFDWLPILVVIFNNLIFMNKCDMKVLNLEVREF